jgi:hypothetical protein
MAIARNISVFELCFIKDPCSHSYKILLSVPSTVVPSEFDIHMYQCNIQLIILEQPLLKTMRWLLLYSTIVHLYAVKSSPGIKKKIWATCHPLSVWLHCIIILAIMSSWDDEFPTISIVHQNKFGVRRLLLKSWKRDT